MLNALLPSRSFCSYAPHGALSTLTGAFTAALIVVGCGKSDSSGSEDSGDGGLDAGRTVPIASDNDAGASDEATLPSTFNWISTAPLIRPIADAQHPILSVKDPSVVFFEDKWHVFATTADVNAQWSLVYLNFSDWTEAANAEFHYLDQNLALTGYHAAPQVFYFEPQDKWYLIFQSQQPQYSTSDDLSDPMSWSTPRDFFAAEPAIVTENAGDGTWLDYWVICDDAKCHLFFTDDNGHFYRSETSINDFPDGFNDPVIAIDGTKSTLFEGSATYRVGESGGYLTLIEAFGSIGERYYRSFVADTLDGEWTPFAASFDNPFAARSNVSFADGEAWTLDVSHGELLRDGHDQSLTIDPENLRFLYQGVDPSQSGVEYYQLPYQLALLTYTDTPTETPNETPAGPSICEGVAVTAMADIADFESGSAGWWSSYDDTPEASHPPLTAEPPGANGTAQALHFGGTGYMSWGANFGTTPGCTDTSMFDGFSFYARGTSGAQDELHVIAQVAAALPVASGGDCAAECYSHPRTTITLTPEWTRYDLPFSAFTPPGWGVLAEYDGTVMGFAFESAGPDFDVWVDELKLYTKGSLSTDAGVPPIKNDAGTHQDGGTSVDSGWIDGGEASVDSGTTADSGLTDSGAAP